MGYRFPRRRGDRPDSAEIYDKGDLVPPQARG